MKGWIAVGLILAGTASAQGMHQVTTASRAMYCDTREAYEDALAAVRAGDRETFTAMFRTQRCGNLPGDRVITVLDGPTGDQGFMLILFRGERLWVVQDHLDYGIGGPPR